MPRESFLEVSRTLRIPVAELTYRASRSSGPGGQHVNTSSTRIEVVWDIAASNAVNEEQRTRLLARLSSRLDSAGHLRVASGETRSQLRNREAVTERLRDLVARALVVPKRRKRTRVPGSEKAARLEAKRRRSDLKRTRRRPQDE